MRVLQRKIINEFYDRSEEKLARYTRKMFGFALIPTILLTIYIIALNPQFGIPEFTLLGIVMSGVYAISFGGIILALDCWSIAEMVSPPVLGRYRNFRTFVKIMMDSPSRREVLRVTKLYNDVIEKNGFENYKTTSEFFKKFYDKQEQQDYAIKARDDKISQLESTIEEMKKTWMDQFKRKDQEATKERIEKEKAIKSKDNWMKIALGLSAIISNLKKRLSSLEN